MKLSDAIRKGSHLTEQVQVVYLRECPETGKICGSCALGAAWVGMYGVDRGLEQIGYRLVQRWPELEDVKSWRTHPVTGGQHSLHYIVSSLNDDHGWTRESIADWLEWLGF